MWGCEIVASVTVEAHYLAGRDEITKTHSSLNCHKTSRDLREKKNISSFFIEKLVKKEKKKLRSK
jgi:hypothetical protein